MAEAAGARRPDALEASAQYLKGVGPQRYELLRRLGLVTIRDVLEHFPRSYQDLRRLVPVARLTPGEVGTVRGEVIAVRSRPVRRGQTLVEVAAADSSGRLTLVWFNQPYQQERFRPGQQLLASGKVRLYRGAPQMVNPLCQVIEDEGDDEGLRYPLLPVYPLTEHLKPHTMRRIVAAALEGYADRVPERYDAAFRQERSLVPIGTALRWIHRPADFEQVAAARRRLIYDEFFLLELALALRRREVWSRRRAPRLAVTPAIDQHIRRRFPFTLTAGQEQAIAEITADLARDVPMNRLLHGEVGSGKTAVALYALLTAVANRHQAALMAPTEVLARQHWHRLEQYLRGSRVRRACLVGGLRTAQRAEVLRRLAAGEMDLVVGTHAIIQEQVTFRRLGLVVVDEQHKFGVMQRARFRSKGVEPHYLVMTATPIPRTLTLTVFGDLDVSVIADLPPGRPGVRTVLVGPRERQEAFAAVAAELAAGRQAYVVYPLVEESEHLDLKAAEQMADQLARGAFRNFRVGLVHGRMDPEEKEAVMRDFHAGRIHVLVSTLVIEVGVDVPNATVMVIEHAERFGLAQLHQLRGRIGRGRHPGTCYLLSDAPTAAARQRLEVLVKTTDGFRIAEEDLRLRGPGEFFGTRQHGWPELRLANLVEDYDLLKLTNRDAFGIVAADPTLSQPDHRVMREEVLRRYGAHLELGHLG